MGEHVDVGLWQGFGVLVYGNVNLLGFFLAWFLHKGWGAHNPLDWLTKPSAPPLRLWENMCDL